MFLDNDFSKNDIAEFSNALKINKTLKKLYLDGNMNFFCFFQKINQYYLLKTGNNIHDEGIELISKALMINNTITHINLRSNCFYIFFDLFEKK